MSGNSSVDKKAVRRFLMNFDLVAFDSVRFISSTVDLLHRQSNKSLKNIILIKSEIIYVDNLFLVAFKAGSFFSLVFFLSVIDECVEL